ncbi:NAD-dependent epimerase/dehydratase family protein [Candidatus Uabimicrobium amorphum]|uniref:Putative UDP-glucose epimerase YtcB n=1 Tax=Uabimicrobium amorphum TaxID=2596890 RepID=A0A5S9F3T0_UABAM|nr:NAD-dependent epimerase/dehydratase family protein [Candidatus Uabimicrobium amorphum]BBM84812.1 putative UDP-glucose epimerase YtcB [Candidatus Uabimicrobium amorphum]
MKKILVTGIAGFIGSNLGEYLRKNDYTVVGIDNFNDYYSPTLKKYYAKKLEELGVKIYHRDLNEMTQLDNDIDFIIHCAAQPGISATTSFASYVSNNINATQNLLHFAKQLPQLQLFVYISTSSVYGATATGPETSELKPTSHYGVTKLCAEKLAMSYYYENQLPVCAMRLFSVYGERERPEKLYPLLIKSIYEKRPFTLFEGSEKHSRSFSYVGDITNGLLRAIQNPQLCIGEIFNLGSDQEVTTAQGIKTIEEITGKKIEIIHVPKRTGDQKRTSANIDKIKTVLNYQPKTTLKQGLQAQVDWYLRDMHNKIKYES